MKVKLFDVGYVKLIYMGELSKLMALKNEVMMINYLIRG